MPRILEWTEKQWNLISDVEEKLDDVARCSLECVLAGEAERFVGIHHMRVKLIIRLAEHHGVELNIKK